MVAHAFGTLGAIFLATVFFTIPLVLKFHVYKPETKHVATGDVFQVYGRISSTWCQAVDLSSGSSFQSFLYKSEPRVNDTDVQRTVVSHQIALPNKGQKYWGFHLLRGTKVNVSTCVRLFGGDLTVVEGYKALKRCLAEHKHVSEMGNDMSAEEDSQSESESDDVTSSISSSQGAVSNETDRMYKCRDALHHIQLPSSYACRAHNSKSSRKNTLFHSINHTDHYYYIFSSDTYLDIIPNEFSVEFAFDRTHYDYTESISNCSSSEHCQLNITLASEEKIVVQMDGVNGTLKVESLRIACKPREWIFCFFYAGFLIVIFLCAFQ